MRTLVLAATAAAALMLPATAQAGSIQCGGKVYREAMKQKQAMPAVRCVDLRGSAVRNYLFARGQCRVYSQTISSSHIHAWPTRVAMGHQYRYSWITVFNGCTGRFERPIRV